MKLTPSSPGFAMLISLVAWISLSASAQKTVDVRVKPEIGTARCPSVDSPPATKGGRSVPRRFLASWRTARQSKAKRIH
jgi:hypothetical protein